MSINFDLVEERHFFCHEGEIKEKSKNCTKIYIRG